MPGPVLTADSSGTRDMKEKKPHVCLVTSLFHRVTNATGNRNSGRETLKPTRHVKFTNLKSP